MIPAVPAAPRSSLGSRTDGFLAQYDREISTRISALLIRTPITPNQITTVSLLVGLLGAWWIADGGHALALYGAILLWIAAILDGCDGEVARLTGRSSPFGAKYDLFADHLAHAATFAALVLHRHRVRPDAPWVLPGTLLATGVGACMFVMWWEVRRTPPERRTEFAVFLQKLCGRDYVYLIFLFALFHRLKWFLWAVAVGSHVFWLSVLLLASEGKIRVPWRSRSAAPLEPAPAQ